MKTYESSVYRRLRQEAQAYRHYNQYYDNQTYCKLTEELAATSSDTDQPTMEVWEWGNLVQDATLELCGHPGFAGGNVELHRALSHIEDDDRREAIASVIHYLFAFAGLLVPLNRCEPPDGMPF